MLLEPAPESGSRRRDANYLGVCNCRVDCAMLCECLRDSSPFGPLQRGPMPGIGPRGRPGARGGFGSIKRPVRIQIEAGPLLAVLAPSGHAFWVQMNDRSRGHVVQTCCQGTPEQGSVVMQDGCPADML